MERQVLDGAGGILSLRSLIDEHGEAFEFDLIRLGVRLRDAPSPELNWRDLWVIANRSGRDTELYRELHPEDDTTWSVTDYLLALVADNTAFRLYQAAGGKGKKPKPVPRPGNEDRKVVKYDTLPVDEMRDWLGADWAA